jgi:hypothetical protein
MINNIDAVGSCGDLFRCIPRLNSFGVWINIKVSPSWMNRSSAT